MPKKVFKDGEEVEDMKKILLSVKTSVVKRLDELAVIDVTTRTEVMRAALEWYIQDRFP